MIKEQLASKADFLVVLGTTGESVTLTDQERHQLARFVVKQVAGRVPLVLGMSGNSTHGLVETISHTDFSGYDAILSVVPYYNKPSQEGMRLHFEAVAKASPVPVVLYNVPGRTGANLDAATTLRLASEHPDKIIAIKEASGRMGQIREILEKKPKDFVVLAGDDALTLPLMAMGAKGIISVIGNALPAEFGQVVHLCQQGRFAEANALDRRLQPFYRLLFAEGNPSGIKQLLALRGLARNILRLPLTPVSRQLQEKLYEALNALKS
jgi:4-hydroxy-tetrahydrodipicolinate synthase